MRTIRRRFSVFMFFIAALLGTLLFYEPHPDKNKPTVAVILGYNFFLRDQRYAESYVQDVCEILRDYKDVRFVVVSGANTVRGSEYSEAFLLKEELLSFAVMQPIILEEKARTTVQNIDNSFKTIEGLSSSLPKDTNIIIFADVVRRHSIWRKLARMNTGRNTYVYGIHQWRSRISEAQRRRKARGMR